MQLNKESLADQISKELQERVVNVEIEQGEKINVSALEKEFGVSRAPVREALQRLVDKGLVEVRSRVGYFAIDLSSKQIEDLCELRKLLEAYSLKESIEHADKSKLNYLLQESINLQKNDHPHNELRKKFDQTDEQLHKTIIYNSNNEFLKDFTERIHNLIALTRHLNERIEEAIKEHIDILRAMRARDEKNATEALNVHLSNVEKEILSRNGRDNLGKK
ncbi:MAG: GntR family transcriptional regulator [Candidatus Bipolaricaulota bacterium]|nr:GntR family transcriptional regulator [Candidatus Bipolaricaulota bacterium]